jgi:ribonuclease HII
VNQAQLFDFLTAQECIAGVDEAGRGPLAGPVFAAAVVLDHTRPLAGLADSKTLSAVQRDILAEQIRQRALGWCVASASVEEIDELNILQATMLAMRRACNGLTIAVSTYLIDGNRIPHGLNSPAQAIVKGDSTVPAISAASILAKTARDALCEKLHEQYPAYDFARHKGYGTVLHRQRLAEFGPCPAHRKSFRPVRAALARKIEVER